MLKLPVKKSGTREVPDELLREAGEGAEESRTSKIQAVGPSMQGKSSKWSVSWGGYSAQKSMRQNKRPRLQGHKTAINKHVAAPDASRSLLCLDLRFDTSRRLDLTQRVAAPRHCLVNESSPGAGIQSATTWHSLCCCTALSPEIPPRCELTNVVAGTSSLREVMAASHLR